MCPPLPPSAGKNPCGTYEYDSSSRLLQRVEGATITNYFWDGWDLLREEKDDGVDIETTDYLVPEGEVFAFKRDGDWFYLHGDALSSTQLVTDDNGAQVARILYSAWGEELHSSESIPGILENRFVGGLGCRRDTATGLVYMRHRWYDIGLGRFISRDPVGLAGGSNLYSYANGNPLNWVDAWGLLSCAVKYQSCVYGVGLVYNIAKKQMNTLDASLVKLLAAGQVDKYAVGKALSKLQNRQQRRCFGQA